MVQTPPFGQPAPALFSFLVAAIKGGLNHGREVWIVVESLTIRFCRLQQVLGGMRDALAHAGFSFHVSRRPSNPALRFNMRHGLGFALAGFSRVVSAPARTTIVYISGAGSPCCPRLKIDFHQDFDRPLGQIYSPKRAALRQREMVGVSAEMKP